MKVVKGYEFSGGVGKESYPWATILDGQPRMIEQGVDFSCKLETYCTLARNAGRRVGKVVKINKVDGGIMLQAVEASPEQLAKWEEADEEKAAEKEAAEAAEPVEQAGGLRLVETEAPKKGKRSKKSS
jgi:hypothetical protein